MQGSASQAIGTVPLLREFSGLLEGYYEIDGPAGARLLPATGRLAQQVAQGEVDKALLRQANEVAGLLMRYPASQVWRVVDGVLYLEEGGRNPLALLVGAPRERP